MSEERSLEEILEGIKKGEISSSRDLWPEELNELCFHFGDCLYCPLSEKCDIECIDNCEECVRYNLCAKEKTPLWVSRHSPRRAVGSHNR